MDKKVSISISEDLGQERVVSGLSRKRRDVFPEGLCPARPHHRTGPREQLDTGWFVGWVSPQERDWEIGGPQHNCETMMGPESGGGECDRVQGMVGVELGGSDLKSPPSFPMNALF